MEILVYYPDFSHPLSGLTHSDRTIDRLPQNLQQLVVRGEFLPGPRLPPQP